MEDRRERRTTVTLGARAITLCSCSTSSVTARGRCSARGTYIARTGGVMYWILSCPATGRQECGDTFARTPHSPSRTSMGTWRSGEFSTQYGCRATKSWQWEIAPLLIRPVGRPPKRPVILYDDFWYRAGSWDRARRVVAKVEWHQGRAVPSGGLHRHEHDGWPRRSGAILQWTRDSRAVDQGG